MKTTIYSIIKQLSTKPGFFLLLILSLGILTNCGQDSSITTGYTNENEETEIRVSGLELDSSDVTDAEFKVFDATDFQEKPDVEKFGIRPMHVMTTNHFWETARNDSNRWEYPTDSSILSALQQIDDSESHTVFVNIPSWPTNSDDEETVKNSTMRFSSLYYDLKKDMPNTNFGFYNALPVKDYWSTEPAQERLDNWREKNDRLQKLGQKVDALFLPTPATATDRELWVFNMKYLIEEARRINDGQPIYLCLWPQNNANDHESLDNNIDSDFWQLQLEFARKYADGIVLHAPEDSRWDTSAPWWTETKLFMERLGQYSAEPLVTDAEFEVFDGTRFLDKPNMRELGFTPVKVIYEMMLWDKPMDEVGLWELPSRVLVEEWAGVAKGVNNELTIIDIEHWPTNTTESEMQKSIENYSTVYDWFKEAQPGMQFGYYDMVPIKNYWAYPTDERLQIWQSRNDKLKPMADKVDALFPQLYTFNQDEDAWVNSARYYLKEAKRISGDKPVYAFLWPQYIAKDDQALDGTYIDAEFWQTQLETARHYADGVVIWFPYIAEWEEASKAPWWDETKDFLQNLGKAK